LIHVKESIPDIKLVILGHGDQDLIDELKLFAEENQLQDHIEFLGFQSNIYDYLAHSDLMVVPSIAEGFGLVFLEAMNANLPIIGFDVPATNEIIKHNETGMVIPPYDTLKMAETIIHLLEHPNILQTLGDNAKQNLSTYFCLDRMVSETINFYHHALKLQT